MTRLRQECPWDAEQTHLSLVPYLVEEACEVVEAIETGVEADLREELGDLLLQVVFHAELASERADGFDLDDVAAGIADKLVSRHPHVFAVGSTEGDHPLGPPDQSAAADLLSTWEQAKAIEKGRTSVLQGIPGRLSALSRASKIISRARSRRVPLPEHDAAAEPIGADELGEALLGLVVRAQASGLDAEQAARAAVRRLEARVREAETG